MMQPYNYLPGTSFVKTLVEKFCFYFANLITLFFSIHELKQGNKVGELLNFFYQGFESHSYSAWPAFVYYSENTITARNQFFFDKTASSLLSCKKYEEKNPLHCKI
jgi:hypothetical protein